MTVLATPMNRNTFYTQRLLGTQFSNETCAVNLETGGNCIVYSVTCQTAGGQPTTCPSETDPTIAICTQFYTSDPITSHERRLPEGRPDWIEQLGQHLLQLHPAADRSDRLGQRNGILGPGGDFPQERRRPGKQRHRGGHDPGDDHGAKQRYLSAGAVATTQPTIRSQMCPVPASPLAGRGIFFAPRLRLHSLRCSSLVSSTLPSGLFATLTADVFPPSISHAIRVLIQSGKCGQSRVPVSRAEALLLRMGSIQPIVTSMVVRGNSSARGDRRASSRSGHSTESVFRRRSIFPPPKWPRA